MNMWQVIYVLVLILLLKKAVWKSTEPGFTGVEADPILLGFILIGSAVLWWFGFFKGMF